MDDLLGRVARLPCGRRLLDAAAGHDGVHLVGGAVRDLLLGREPRELDVVVEGDVEALARRLGAAATVHERFGTATVQSDGCRFDLAAARAETYARPGALPDVRPAGIDADLRRRDVTINALALDLASGELREVAHAREDLAAGRLRVLHDASFDDDPTRLWRIARYAARLGFDLEERTAALATAAVAAAALDTVSGDRIGNELRLALGEPDPIAALAAAAALGLAPWLAPDRERADAALALLPAGEGRPDLVVLGAALTGEIDAPRDGGADAALAGAAAAPRDGGADAALTGEAAAPLDGLGFTAAERAVLRACARAPQLAAAMASAAQQPSALARVLRGQPVEAVALAGAHGAAAPARRWLDELRHVALAITGDDLLAAGVPHGPQIGRRLAAALDRRLDGALAAGRDAELAAALQAPADS
jgi:tRNA nucleotidyltransferase (CCA-adding enzyme)